MQRTLQRSWTASRSIIHCSDTEKSSIRFYSICQSLTRRCLHLFYTCHPGPSPQRVDRVPRGCRSHRCKAKLKRSSPQHILTAATTITALAKTQMPLCLSSGTTMTALARHKGYGWTDQNNSIHSLRKNINVVTIPTGDVSLRHFRKT